MSEVAPDLQLKINADTLDEVHQAKERFNADIVETSINNFIDEYKSLFRELELKTMIWEQPWSIDLFKRILRSGVDMINLNDPHLFLQVKRELEKR